MRTVLSMAGKDRSGIPEAGPEAKARLVSRREDGDVDDQIVAGCGRRRWSPSSKVDGRSHFR